MIQFPDMPLDSENTKKTNKKANKKTSEKTNEKTSEKTKQKKTKTQQNKRPKLSIRKALARLLAIQASYEIEIKDENVDNIIKEYLEKRIYEQNKDPQINDFKWANKIFFQNIVKGCYLNIEYIDEVIEKKLSNRKLKQIEIILQIILRLGVYELLSTDKIVKSVIIEEYIKLAQVFFYNDSPALVNAILEAVINDASIKLVDKQKT